MHHGQRGWRDSDEVRVDNDVWPMQARVAPA